MIYCFNLSNAYVFGDVIASMHKLRYQEFIERKKSSRSEETKNETADSENDGGPSTLKPELA